VLIVLTIALGVPLALNLQRRVTAEIENNALVQAHAVAAAVGPDTIQPDGTANGGFLRQIADSASTSPAVRILIVNADGIVLADSAGIAVGDRYATPSRPEIRAALDGDPVSFLRYSDTEGRELIATAVPIIDEGGSDIVGAVRVTQDAKPISDSVRRVRLGLVALGLAGVAAGLVIAFGLSASLSRPLTRLANAAKRLGGGDLTTRAEVGRGPREIEELARSFDEMADRLERTVHAQRSFVANASHQLRTPLTGMKLRIEAAIDAATGEDDRHELEAADHEVDRLSKIVDRLLSISRDIEEGRPTEVDLADVVARALARWESRAERLGTRLLARGDGGTAQGNAMDLDQIVDNLLDNAISYAPGEITLESGHADGRAFVAVQDHGPGIDAEDLERVTERFYRGRGAPSGGSGLGLAIARELAEKWGGTLVVASGPGEGTRVEVRLSSSA
jgi:two-component system, OmpR family, sensor kinase